ncbi:MAG TPA: class I SAM-dependent methyltransferase [Vicinamibacteria bacterium]|nr:class I SAM-dependent methyltransferase [Vicinamibacteria bacterium]
MVGPPVNDRTLRTWSRLIVACWLLLLGPATAQAQPRSRSECEAAHPAAWGRAGKDVVWVPTFDAVVLAMLSMAQVTPQDVVLDLGAGDGKIAIAAAKSFGARAVGIEYDPEMARLAACLVQAEGLGDRVRIVEGDIFKEDFGDASVVTMYLLPHLNLCVRHRLLAMEPGTRVVSHQYAMRDWNPEQSVDIQGRHVHMWVVPARVGGAWDFRDSQGTEVSIELRQTFGELSGDVVRGGVRAPLGSATLRGRELRFAFEAAGGPAKFSGTVRGREITGVMSTGSVARTANGRLRGEPQGAPWGEMVPGCGQYYLPARP